MSFVMCAKGILTGITTAALVASGAKAPVPEAPVNEDVLGEYVESVVTDSDVFVDDYAAIIDEYVNDTVEKVDDLVQGNTTGKEFAQNIEQKAEEFADALEARGDEFGNLQEKNGDAFGNKFDQETAKTVVNVVSNLFKRFR